MQRANEGTQMRSYRFAAVFVLALAAVVAAFAAPAARAQQQQAGYGRTTGLVGIVQGQRARLAVWNKGDEPVRSSHGFSSSMSRAKSSSCATPSFSRVRSRRRTTSTPAA